MVDDGAAARQRSVDRARLDAVARILRRLLVGPLGHRDALNADRIAGRVHHDEHVLEAAVLLADELAHRARRPPVGAIAELQHRGRARLDAQLVLDADAGHVVARAQRAVGRHHELGHDEEADALHALRRADHPREHEVDDVGGHVVVAVGDEDLGAEEPVGPVGLRLGPGSHLGQVRAGLRLGQVHGAGPLAVDHARQVERLLLGRAGDQQGLDRAVGQQRAQREAQVGAVEHLDAGRADRLRQALAAKVTRMLQALPAALAELPERLLEARCGRHLTRLPGRRMAVALDVERSHHRLVEARALLQHGRRGVEAGILESGQRGDRLQVGKLAHAEEHVGDGGAVGHGGSFLVAATSAGRSGVRTFSRAP